jgi:exosortase F-associated protein
MAGNLNMSINILFRWAYILFALAGMLLVYLFQNINISAYIGINEWPNYFLVNRIVRFILNDFFAILLLWGIFQKREYVILGLWVQLFGVVFVLIPYLILKVAYPGYWGVLISFLHRLVINPLLILILIPALWYMENKSAESKKKFD